MSLDLSLEALDAAVRKLTPKRKRASAPNVETFLARRKKYGKRRPGRSLYQGEDWDNTTFPAYQGLKPLWTVDAAVPAPVDFGDKPLSGLACFDMFLDAAKRMWKSEVLFEKAKFSFKVEESINTRDGRVLASLQQKASCKQAAFSDHLLQFCFEYKLIIAKELLTKPRDFVERIMIHEAAHIGYGNHGRGFRDVVRKYGGAMTETAAGLSKPFKLQEKQGARYVTIDEFEDEDIARGRMAQLARDTGKRYRLSF